MVKSSMNRRGRQLHLERARDPDCRRCQLYKSSKNVCVLGRGNPMSPIMAVGEALGATEERTGKPFMGRAGKLLDRCTGILCISHLVYVTNIVHCRPPDNKDPTKKEIDTCIEYLKEEVAIVQPKIVLLMGRTAIKAFGFGSDVNATSSYFYCEGWPGAYIKGTWHPAYCLRRGREPTKQLLEALKWAKEMVTCVSTQTH